MGNHGISIVIKEYNNLTPDEVYEMCKVRYEVFACEQEITCENDFDDRDKKCSHVFLYDNKRLVAYCRILPRKMAYDSPSIGRVLVLKEYRKNGLAEIMMEAAMDYIKNTLNEKEIILSSQLYIKGLYEKVGFTPISEIYDEAEIPHIKMKKIL